MLRIQLICTGRLKESFYADACAEHDKRLRRYCAPEIVELPETGDVARDGEAMLKKLPPDAFVVAMCVEGKAYSSEELSGLLRFGLAVGVFLLLLSSRQAAEHQTDEQRPPHTLTLLCCRAPDPPRCPRHGCA